MFLVTARTVRDGVGVVKIRESGGHPEKEALCLFGLYCQTADLGPGESVIVRLFGPDSYTAPLRSAVIRAGEAVHEAH